MGAPSGGGATAYHATVALCAAVALAALGLACRPGPAAPDNIVLVLVDTLRADHLGCYGYGRDTSPELDRLAGSGLLFRNAFSVAPWTNPAVASVLTGRYPQAVLAPALHRRAIELPLPAAVDTLAERFRAAQYRTIALVDHPGISRELGFGQGFGTFVRLYREAGVPVWSKTPLGFVRGELARQLPAGDGAPFFLYLHLVYPHRPYLPPASHRHLFGPASDEIRVEERDALINAYDASIRYTDDLIGELYRLLRERGVAEHTWLLVTSDHGEGFWEHGLSEHGNSLFEELLRVPLLLVPPEGRLAPRASDAPVSLVDVYPTLLDAAGLPVPADLDGRSLLPRERDPSPRPLFAESPHSGDEEGASVRRGPLKYVAFDGGAGDPRALYDLARDPGEIRNLLPGDARADALARALERHRARSLARREQLASEPRVPVDAETQARLRALGYVDE